MYIVYMYTAYAKAGKGPVDLNLGSLTHGNDAYIVDALGMNGGKGGVLNNVALNEVSRDGTEQGILRHGAVINQVVSPCFSHLKHPGCGACITATAASIVIGCG